MSRRPIGVDAASTRAVLESILVELHRLLPDAQLSQALEEVVTVTRRLDTADAYKALALVRRGVEKLVRCSAFDPSDDLLGKLALQKGEVADLRYPSRGSAATVETSDTAVTADGLMDLRDYESDPNPSPTWEDLKEVFRVGHVMRAPLSGDCLVLGHAEQGDLCRSVSLSVQRAGSFQDEAFRYIDSCVPTRQHEESGRTFVVKAVPYAAGLKGRVWTGRSDGRRVHDEHFFVALDDRIKWVDPETFRRFASHGTSAA